MQTDRVTIDDRFRGPPRSGNGGYVCGLMASHLAGTVAARLRAPPPLGEELLLETAADRARLLHGDTLIGEARSAVLDIVPPSPPSYPQAVQASPSYVGHTSHPFPCCFVCGPDRAVGDGLRIFPGAIEGADMVAAPWVPDASVGDGSRRVRPEFLWSALDCVGGVAWWQQHDRPMAVLGELCASLVSELRVGERCIVTGWRIGRDGRKAVAGSAVHAEDGRLVALARAVWIAVPQEAWGSPPRQPTASPAA